MFFLLTAAGQVFAQACTVGSWDAPFNHQNGTATAPNGTRTATPTPTWAVETGASPNFNAMHMALIPKGEHQGKVLVIDHEHALTASHSFQKWSIVDPNPNATTRFDNVFLQVGPLVSGPPAYAEWLFCCGHAWTQEGELFLAGGERVVYGQAAKEGTNLTFIFDPLRNRNAPYGGIGDWVRGPLLQNRVWYPTVLLTHLMARTSTEGLIVAGGSTVVDGTPQATWNLYEAFKVPGPVSLGLPVSDVPAGFAGPVFPGPQIAGPFLDSFLEYPRLQVVSNGDMIMSGYVPPSARVNHDSAPPTSSASWVRTTGQPGPASPAQRVYGSSFHHPNVGGLQDLIVRLGGRDDFNPITGVITDSMEICQALTQTNWSSMPSMTRPRDECNAVLLPDASWIVFGGRTPQNPPSIPPAGPFEELVPEQFIGGSWRDLARGTSPRSYHSTTMLLADGRVFVAAGNTRTSDYEIFTPPYLCPTAAASRPTTVMVNATFDTTDRAYHLAYNTTYTVSCDHLPPGNYLDKVVLMAPGSDTHHSDMSQRYVELSTEAVGSHELSVRTPLNTKFAQRGYYMLFLMNGNGVPSVARWVKLI